MKNILIVVTSLLISVSVQAQDKPAYQIFTGDGDEVRYGKMLKELQKADFVFYGESHNNPIAHWLELEITRDLFEEKGQELVLGAEMFETDNQILIDELFNGFLTDKKFTEDCRLWKNYPTDYKPLLMFAKDKKIPFVATNIPRRYASLVASKGFDVLDSLSPEAKAFLPPLPIAFDPEVPCYKNMLSMMEEMTTPAAGGKGATLAPVMPAGAAAAMPAAAAAKMPATTVAAMPATVAAMPAPVGAAMAAHGGQNTVKAQAIKDATMAWFINKYYKPGKQFIHYNGSYHSDKHEGIIWYLRKLQPNATIVVITTVSQDELKELGTEGKGKGDFVVVVQSRMTNTY
ncbi:MAG: ChaN family lipoprotein [Bacteroidia bacterium]|nr:ChaN family lipoprotein [Bacteroidia bacterium]